MINLNNMRTEGARQCHIRSAANLTSSAKFFPQHRHIMRVRLDCALIALTIGESDIMAFLHITST